MPRQERTSKRLSGSTQSPHGGKVEKKTTKERTTTPQKGLDKLGRKKSVKTPTKKKAGLDKFYEGDEPKVIVDNLLWSTQGDAVKEFFSACGPITSFQLFTNSKGEITGKGEILFEEIDSANNALSYDGVQFLGSYLYINDQYVSTKIIATDYRAAKRPEGATEADFREAFKACAGVQSIRFLNQSLIGFIEFDDIDKAVYAFNYAQNEEFKVAGKRIYFQYAHPREKVSKEDIVMEEVRSKPVSRGNSRRTRSPKLTRADLDNNWRKH